MEESMKATITDNMAEILQSEGPIVQMVILKADGTVSEETFDSTPSKNHLSELMGGPVTILGKYHQLDTILLRLRSPQPETSENSHTLHAPFTEEKIIGPIAMVRMNEEALPVDFTKPEYETFKTLTAEEVAKREDEAIAKEEAAIAEEDAEEIAPEAVDPEVEKEMNAAFDAVEGEGDGEENMDEEMAAADLLSGVQDFKSQLLNQVVGFYQEQHGRDPTEEETLEAMKQVLRTMAGQGEANEEEEENEEEKPEATPEKVNRKRPADEISEQEQPAKKKIKISGTETN